MAALDLETTNLGNFSLKSSPTIFVEKNLGVQLFSHFALSPSLLTQKKKTFENDDINHNKDKLIVSHRTN